MKHDRMNRPIEIGDAVAYVEGGASGGYDLEFGKIIKISENTVLIERAGRWKRETRKRLDKIVIITEQIEANKEKFPELFV